MCGPNQLSHLAKFVCSIVVAVGEFVAVISIKFIKGAINLLTPIFFGVTKSGAEGETVPAWLASHAVIADGALLIVWTCLIWVSADLGGACRRWSGRGDAGRYYSRREEEAL